LNLFEAVKPCISNYDVQSEKMSNNPTMNNQIYIATDHYYTTRELATLFRANESTIKRWANKGALKCFKTPGGHRKFTPQHVLDFVQKYHFELLIDPQKEL
jgi:excisionase family DNA binding protein